MSIHISNEAAKWFKEEMDLEQGDHVQFFLKIYGGIPTVHPNYFLGVAVGKQGSIREKDETEGITFYYNDEDEWFFSDYNLEVIRKNDEVEYIFNNK
ncbi:hypothetical protein GMD78_19675 [Ornithinibacillus sp. L9]|uniref:YneR n=1 Tax=Ornithinibacillus caprae TaxID=2678566 RepID=A0A6N8FLR4_9BACI|nr:hypothetical protein [Ornithinibacillus caprae]MUK90580.1 hypothetical protein [Ornithinibacillus caprae]